jgi:predicted phage tail protein
MNMIDNNEQLDAWVQSKLTKAQDYLQSVSDYLTGEEGEVEELYEKKAKKDYDGDGKIESSREEYKGVKDKAIKNTKGLAEIIAKKLKESSYKAPSNSVEAQSLKKGDVIGSGETVVSVSSGAYTPSGKVDVTLEKDGKIRKAVWGKYTKVGIKKLKESSYKAPSNSVEAGSLKKGDVLGSGETVVSVSSGAKTPSGKVNVTLEKNGKTRTAVWGKYTKVGIKKS